MSCVAATFDSIDEILQEFKQQGIKRIVALRGDMPSGMHARGDFNYASDLVEFIRKQTGDYFKIEVAAYPEMHPQALNPVVDLESFKIKVDAGADRAITQYFYNIDAYFSFIDECEKKNIDLPIIPGIMPIINLHSWLDFQMRVVQKFHVGCASDSKDLEMTAHQSMLSARKC